MKHKEKEKLIRKFVIDHLDSEIRFISDFKNEVFFFTDKLKPEHLKDLNQFRDVMEFYYTQRIYRLEELVKLYEIHLKDVQEDIKNNNPELRIGQGFKSKNALDSYIKI